MCWSRDRDITSLRQLTCCIHRWSIFVSFSVPRPPRTSTRIRMVTPGKPSKNPPRPHPTHPRPSTQPAAASRFSTRTSSLTPSWNKNQNQTMTSHPSKTMTMPTVMVCSSHRSPRTREQNNDAQTGQLSSLGPPLPLQIPPAPPPSSDPPVHSPAEPMRLRKQAPPSSIPTPLPSLVFQTSNSACTKSPPYPPSPPNRAADLVKSMCFSRPSRFKDLTPSA